VTGPLLELRGVGKRFGARVAVDSVSLELQPGEIFGLLGPNGAGKTTLLRMCVDLLRPDSGELKLFGERPGPHSLERIGYLPEERGLPSRSRVFELLGYLGELKGMKRAAALAQAALLLERVQLDARVNSRIGELSKGNQQKVQIAAALMGEPRVLLVDEPFSGLDPVNRALVVELLQEAVGRGCAVLISTHQLQQVEELCQRLVILHRGRVLLEGEVKEVRARFSDGSLLVQGQGDFAALPSVAKVLAHGRAQRIFLRPGRSAGEALREMIEAGLELRAFEPAVPTLDEIFVQVVSAQDESAPLAEAV